jgi:hypothetical protein
MLATQRDEYPLPSIPETVQTVTALLQNTPRQLAIALTAYEGLMFTRIRPADYIDDLQQYQGPNRVADARLTTLKITRWVQQRMLRADQVQRRGQAYKFFLKTAEVGHILFQGCHSFLLFTQACYELRNFSSMAAIVIALESEVIQCLKETLKELEASDRTLQAWLDDFVRTESAYHTALNSSEESSVPRLSQ